MVSDRACWAAAVTRRLHHPDPVMIGAFLSLGYPVGGATPSAASVPSAGIPLAGTPWHGEPRTPATVLTISPGPAAGDWRRDYGEAMAGVLREPASQAPASQALLSRGRT